MQETLSLTTPQPTGPDPLGLLEVHKPTGPPVATVVCVHNIGGGSMKSWTGIGTGSPFFWLRDGLACDLPRLRILSYGYSSPALGFLDNFHSIEVEARSLSQLLDEGIRGSGASSPIIFVAHGLGGILVKNVLLFSARSATRTLDRLTSAVLFFGTPHRGPGTAAPWATFTRAVGDHSSRRDRSDPRLQTINEAWLHIAHNYSVFSFYETIPTRRGGSYSLVVSREQATLNIANESISALAKSHQDLVKFLGRDDPSYHSVRGFLRNIERDILDKHGPRDKPIVRLLSTPPTPPDSIHAEEPLRIDFEAFIYGLGDHGLAKALTCSVSDLHEKSPSELLRTAAPLEGFPDGPCPLSWAHIPLTNTAWVNPCLQSISKSHEADLLITEDKYWLSRERKISDNIPHSRHFEPSSFLQSKGKSRQFVIYFPYIHWDTVECFSKWSAYLDAAHCGKPGKIPSDLLPRTQAVYSVMRDDCVRTSSLHPRRTLDQSFYSTLPKTFARDLDQVVSKNTVHSRGGKKMVMVDQLWLWVIRTSEPRNETAIFTCFPQKYEENTEDCLHSIADLRQAVVDGMNEWGGREGPPRWNDLVSIVLDQAVNAMLSVRNEPSLDFLSVFRTAIAKATDLQSGYFSDFQHQLASHRSDLHDRDTKREEVELALEIADILDELNSIDRLFEAQEDALHALRGNILEEADTMDEVGSKDEAGLYRDLAAKVRDMGARDVAGYRRQVKRMMEDARRTKANLIELLDLQQKEETLREAQHSNQQATAAHRQAVAAREQADETAAQSQILFLFTGVTIIFLPLSFFTSYFGMNVTEITGEEGNTAHGAVWRVMGPVSGTLIVGLLGAAVYMYRRALGRQKQRSILGEVE